VQKNLWATQKHIEEILDEAYQTSSEIFLIFAASNSGEFYGYAKWVVSSSLDYTMSKPFKVKWICTERLPFNRVNHLRNAWNDDRPVRVSNDGMELEPAVGALLLKEWVKERKRR
ncbi:hypothetical protein GYMLUDRAFT_131327, partial [Collybiopsis luxurians FD-317 M1]